MFQSARIKLTLWYLLIIMMVSLFFSFVIYIGVNQEFTRIEQMEKRRLEEQKKGISSAFQLFIQQRQDQGLPLPKEIRIIRRVDPEMIEQSRMRIILTLAGVNGIILLISGLAGYFLAGRTLKPIALMLDEQNRFITDASHELRTPLTALKSTIEVNLRDKKLTTVQARDVLQSNLEEVNNLQLLSDNLIHLAQYPNGNKKLFEKTAISVVIDEAVKKVLPLAKNKQITIDTEKKEGYVMAEKNSLVELFVILLDNAIKYSPEKSGITITTKIPDGKVIVMITDSGIGIEKEDLPKIFDRFYRANSSRSKYDASGYGLGLSIAKQIVKMHNGNITAESVVEKGTTFTITLPKV